jgi:putative transposase
MEHMSIIKIEVSVPEAVEALAKFRENRVKALEELTSQVKTSFADAMNQLMGMEMSIFLGHPDETQNKRNGFKEKDYTFKGIGTVRVRVPRDRDNKFQSVIVPNSERTDPRIKEDLALLHLAGISNRVLASISKRIFGIKLSKDAVHQSLQELAPKAVKWLERPLSERYWALYVDGTNFNVQRRGSTDREPTLVVLGISEDGHRSVLAMEPGSKDSAECWRSVFHALKARGLDAESVRIGIMDGLPGLEKVFREEFPKAVTARCWVHAGKNAANRCPEKLKDSFKILMNKAMYASSLDDARRAFSELKHAMGNDGRKAVETLEKDLESLLAHYAFDKNYWRALKTTNPIERINKELKRRTKSMDSVGETTLMAIQAFIALRIEMGWRQYRVDDKRHEGLDRLTNRIELATQELLH